MKTIPAVSKYMSTSPLFIEDQRSLADAVDLMSQHQIHHLPVLSDGDLVGLLSDRDLNHYLGFEGVDAEIEPVSHVADREIYTVAPTSPITEVAAQMAERRIGSAVVVDNNKVVGIFTSVDALRALSELALKNSKEQAKTHSKVGF